MSPQGRPVPAPDRDSRPWWDALSRHELTLQECDDCSKRRWPPRELCGKCGSFSWQWVPAVGTGTVASWIVNHHRFFDAGGDSSVVVLVRLDDADDVLMLGGWSGAQNGSGMAVGMPVEVGYEDVHQEEGDFTLVVWQLPS